MMTLLLSPHSNQRVTVCLVPRNNPLHFEDDPDYDTDPEFKKRFMSQAKEQYI